MATYHTPVMVEEVIRFLEPSPDRVYLDGTLGTGGHAEAVLKMSAPTGRVVGIDADSESLEIARKRLEPYGDRIVFAGQQYAVVQLLHDRLQTLPNEDKIDDVFVRAHRPEKFGLHPIIVPMQRLASPALERNEVRRAENQIGRSNANGKIGHGLRS